MKKIIAILFLFIFTASALHADELLKLPTLFSHYISHKKEDPSMSFISFISMHYMQGNVIDEDYSQDMQLPFKTLSYTAAGIVLSVPARAICAAKPFTESVAQEFTTRHLSLHHSFYMPAIWQPPKSI